MPLVAKGITSPICLEFVCLQHLLWTIKMSNQLIATESGGVACDGAATSDYFENIGVSELQFTTTINMRTVSQIWRQRAGTTMAHLSCVSTSLLAASGHDDSIINEPFGGTLWLTNKAAMQGAHHLLLLGRWGSLFVLTQYHMAICFRLMLPWRRRILVFPVHCITQNAWRRSSQDSGHRRRRRSVQKHACSASHHQHNSPCKRKPSAKQSHGLRGHFQHFPAWQEPLK